MSFSVNTNVAAFNAHRNLSNIATNQNKALERLSSGFRINRAADDAAGLAISEGLRSQIGGLKVAARNSQDGISVVQTAEGALTEVHSILQRMRDLAVQGANDSNNADARSNISKEVASLTAELTRIADSTNFNGRKLLDGTAGNLQFQVGANGDTASVISVNMSTVNVAAVASNLGTGGASFEVLTPTAVAGTLSFTNGTTDVSVNVGVAGTHNTVQSVTDALNSNTNFAANFSASVDQDNKLVVTSKTGGTVTGGTAATPAAAGTGVSTSTPIAAGLDFTTSAGARAAVTTIDNQIKAISTSRAELGAYQNRFEHTIKNINVAVENLSASEGRIRDTDMALEMVNFTKNQILTQAGTAMLAQANASAQNILSLLR